MSERIQALIVVILGSFLLCCVISSSLCAVWGLAIPEWITHSGSAALGGLLALLLPRGQNGSVFNNGRLRSKP